MAMIPLRINTPYCSFTQLLLPHWLGFLSCLKQPNQNNAGTYSRNHGQPWLFQDDSRLPASCKLPRAKVNKCLVEKVVPVDVVFQCFYCLCWFNKPWFDNSIVFTFIKWPERPYNEMLIQLHAYWICESAFYLLKCHKNAMS